MATITACTAAPTCLLQKTAVKAAPAARVVGLPSLRSARVVCSAQRQEKRAAIAAATIAAAASTSFPALAVVEETMGGEGVGLPFGLNTAGLTWILAGVFTIVWALYFVYSSSLPEGDDDSGLGL